MVRKEQIATATIFLMDLLYIMAKQFSFQSHDVMFCICQLAGVNVHSLQETGDVARHLQDLRVVEFLKILHFPEVA